jgi:hypothetical protein
MPINRRNQSLDHFPAGDAVKAYVGQLDLGQVGIGEVGARGIGNAQITDTGVIEDQRKIFFLESGSIFYDLSSVVWRRNQV